MALDHRIASSPSRARGLTLLEALIALLVLSVGLVGIASLHLLATRSAHSSLMTSTASVIALDLEEWLWEALASQADAGIGDCPDFDAAVTALKAHWQEDGPNPPTGSNAWPEADRLRLPNLDIVVVDGPTEDDDGHWIEGTIEVRWSEDRLIDVDETQSLEFTARVACPPDAGGGT